MIFIVIPSPAAPDYRQLRQRPMDERCLIIDVCIANPAPTELALCLMNWNCAVDDIARETRCAPRPQ